MAKLGLEARMTIKELSRRGMSRCAIARTLGITEGTIRYHLRRQAQAAVDGRSRQTFLAAGWHEAIVQWLRCQGPPKESQSGSPKLTRVLSSRPVV